MSDLKTYQMMIDYGSTLAHLAHDDLEKLSPPIIGAWSLPPNIEPYYSQ